MTAEEHAHVQHLEADVKRFRARIVTLKSLNGDLFTALVAMVNRYTSLVNCGDCGNWDPETEEPVIAARAAMAKTEAHGSRGTTASAGVSPGDSRPLR